MRPAQLWRMACIGAPASGHHENSAILTAHLGLHRAWQRAHTIQQPMTIRTRVLLVAACFAGEIASQDFHLMVTESPAGSGAGLNPVERFRVAGSGGVATRLTDVAKELTNDPASVVFRSPVEVLVGSRHGNSGPASISRFVLSSDGSRFVSGPRITGNGLSGVHQIVINPVDGELFAANLNGGVVSRFKFDSLGTAIPNGTITMPDSLTDRGVAVRAADQQLFVSALTIVRRFKRNNDGSYSHIGNFSIPGATSVHYMKFRNDELYACDYTGGNIHRFKFDASGAPVANGSVPAPNAIDLAFSPDGTELFSSSHSSGGVRRYSYNSASDTWTFTAAIAGPSFGGIAISPFDSRGSFGHYGTGCAGTGGRVPSHGATGSSARGGLVQLLAFDCRPTAVGALLGGGAAGNIPLPGGCSLLINGPILSIPMSTDANGAWGLTIGVPLTIGPGDAFFEVAVVDPGSGNGLYATSNGVQIRVY